MRKQVDLEILKQNLQTSTKQFKLGQNWVFQQDVVTKVTPEVGASSYEAFSLQMVLRHTMSSKEA